MKTAVFPGSFDPMTYGHLEVVRTASLLFDRVVILVASNPDKKYLFTIEERCDLIKSFRLPANARIDCTDLLVSDWMRDNNLCWIVRGVRDASDVLPELKLADINTSITFGNIRTVFLQTSNERRVVSSSLVKQLVMFRKEVTEYTTYEVDQALGRKLWK